MEDNFTHSQLYLLLFHLTKKPSTLLSYGQSPWLDIWCTFNQIALPTNSLNLSLEHLLLVSQPRFSNELFRDAVAFGGLWAHRALLSWIRPEVHRYHRPLESGHECCCARESQWIAECHLWKEREMCDGLVVQPRTSGMLRCSSRTGSGLAQVKKLGEEDVSVPQGRDCLIFIRGPPIQKFGDGTGLSV